MKRQVFGGSMAPTLLERLRDPSLAVLSRSCGYPRCDERLTVSLMQPESGWKGQNYCDGHRDAANRRRKKLRKLLAEIEALLDSPAPGSRGRGQTPGMTRADLRRWHRRIQWELDGIPNPTPPGSRPAPRTEARSS